LLPSSGYKSKPQKTTCFTSLTLVLIPQSLFFLLLNDGGSGLLQNVLRKSTKDVRIVGIPAWIRTAHLPNVRQKRYRLNKPARWVP
jgi:hypothetical protein